MDFLTLVQEARSCRRFVEAEPLSSSDVTWLLECARVAPSARNAQTLRFITVQGATLARLFPLTHWAAALKDWQGPDAGERPTAFIAVLMPESGGDLLCYDVGIACQTMQLAAASRGWGACMLNSFDRQKTAELLQVPHSLKIALLLGLGVAAEKRVVAPMPADGSLAYWRDVYGVHYVPKLPLSQLIIARFD